MEESTTDIIGIFDSNTHLATSSSLNAHKSSMLPPPLPTIYHNLLQIVLHHLL